MLLAFPTTTELLIPNTYTTANTVPIDLVSQHVNNLLQANQHVTEACVFLLLSICMSTHVPPLNVVTAAAAT